MLISENTKLNQIINEKFSDSHKLLDLESSNFQLKSENEK